MRYGITFVISISLACSAGCERYKQKQAARERRLDYLRSVIDSSRVAHDAHHDSLRRAVTDSLKADSVKKAKSQKMKP